MYYAFNAFTGRLVSASHARAFVPQGLHMLAVSKVVAETTAKTAVAAASANLSTSPIVKSADSEHEEKLPPASDRIKRLQAHFQRDDDLPVYLSGGPMDKYLYYASAALPTVGFGYVLYAVYPFL